MDTHIVSMENVSFSYEKTPILENVNLYVDKGDFVGIIGPNGSAKTTLIKLMIGLLKPSEGKIKLFGEAIDDFKDYHKIGYVSQNVRNFNQMFPATVEEVVGAGINARKSLISRIKGEDKERIDEALKKVEMLDYKKQKVGNLSGGQKQRVFIARALINNPEILFMDEPLVGVDLDSQNKFYDLLDRLREEYNITIVMVSHDIGIISEKVNRLFCLSNGKVYDHDLTKDIDGAHILKDLFGENVKFLFHKH
ncbi:MAG: metal ABC transporter ATP-binding protein [Tissierellales bacterium]|jgi:zinc transport system ATP-binding protein